MMPDRPRALILWVMAAMTAALIALPGCDELNLDWDTMKNQPMYKPYAASAVMKNNASAHKPVQGTVPRRATIGEPPRPRMTLALLKRGRQRFDIYCAVCHGRDGYGEGMVVQRGFPKPPSLHIERLRKAPDRYIEHVIVHGLGKMPSYRYEIKPLDRAAVVAYIRALQLSQHAKVADIPTDKRDLLAVSPPTFPIPPTLSTLKTQAQNAAEQNAKTPSPGGQGGRP